MRTVCDINKCAGCMACVDICSQNAINIEDDLLAYNAVIDSKKCIDCGACRSICPNNTAVPNYASQKWYQGWSKDEKVRSEGSSGGVASAIATAFVQNGGYVCSCTFKDGTFKFEIVNNINDINKFKGSKYVKSNPRGIYKRILVLLKNNEKVLFIGLPCQVAAVKNFVSKYDKMLYTIELICHGTPSPKVLEIYLKQHGFELNALKEISFRYKKQFRLEPIIKSGMQDSYLMAFLEGIDFTENCYSCQYAKIERVADVALGDSWGSNLSKDEVKKGISLLLSQTQKGDYLIEQANLQLEDVDVENAIKHNGQLISPSISHKNRIKLIDYLKYGENFDRLVIRLLPKRFIIQCIKFMLTKLKIIRGGTE